MRSRALTPNSRLAALVFAAAVGAASAAEPTVLNRLIKGLLLGIEHDSAPERNPFKKGEPA
jgi:hypothetical protein